MGRYIIRRVALSFVTLFILLVIVFFLTTVLADNPASIIAGPFAPEARVQEIAERCGLNDSTTTQFVSLLGDTVTFFTNVDSCSTQEPVWSGVVWPALQNSAKLVAFALVMMIPVSIAGGVLAARRKDTLTDRTIVTTGLATSAIPDFVTAVLLQYIIGVQLGWFPALAQADEGASVLTQLNHLFLPALTIVVVYFGYIARMTRAGTIQALESDYTRTAYMKGMGTTQVVRRHVLRNALQPTVAVIGTSMGYLFGGLVGIEIIFNYSGLGKQIVDSALKGELVVLQASVIVVAIIFMIATLAADVIIAWMNPRARLGGD
ncbi:MAG: ABC transporter permease [Acidimicrobiales bacterium]